MCNFLNKKMEKGPAKIISEQVPALQFLYIYFLIFSGQLNRTQKLI